MLVNSDALFPYPIEPGTRIVPEVTMRFPYRWWLNSQLRLTADPEVRAAAFDLICISQDEDPPGTLPTNEEMLARMSGFTLDEWLRLMRRDPSPLHGWELANCGARGIRHYHPVCLRIAQEALSGDATP